MGIEAVSVIASGTVALAAIGAGAWQHGRGLKHERKLADLENVRDVLDEAAVLLHRVAYVLDEIRAGLTQYGAAFFKDETRVEKYRQLERAGQECDALRERLAVRLGRTHQAVRTFTDSGEAVLAIYRALGLIRFEMEPPPDPGAAAKQVAKIVEGKQDEITKQRAVFDHCRVKFMDAAQRTAGAQLPDSSG